MRTSLSLCVRVFLTSIFLIIPGAIHAGDWPGWRGPTGQGQSDEKELPLEWDAKTGKNILWKTLLHGGRKKNPDSTSPGWSSPIVWKDRVFVTTSIWPEGVSDKERRKTISEHHVLCLQASDGKQLWDTLVPPGQCVVEDGNRGYAVPTPVTDGKQVYALFGSGVIAALDFDGKIVWREELPRLKDVGSGICSSPILHEEMIIFPSINDMGLRALDKQTGKLKWEQKAQDRNREATPAIVRTNDRVQLVHLANSLQSLDPASGETLWFCKGLSTGLASPVFGAGLIYADSGRGGSCDAVEATGKGDVTKTNVKWHSKAPSAGGSSAIVVGDLVYRSADPGRIVCRKMDSGEVVYDERAQRISPSASPISTADGRIYFTSSNRSYVIKAGPTFEVLASNDLDDGPDYASAAVSDGRLFIKGRNYLWCIGTKAEK